MKYRLGDLARVSSSKRIHAKEYVANGIPFYRGKEIIELGSGHLLSNKLFISKDRFNQIKSKYNDVPEKDDVLITAVGTIGETYLVKSRDLPFYFKDGNLIKLSKWNRQIVLPEYMYYWLNSYAGKMAIKKITIGSTQQAITIRALSDVELDLPPISEQGKIAQGLSTLDFSIDNNNQINANLDEINKTVFSNFFANQNSITKASDIADIRIGKTPPRKQKKWFSLNGGYKWLSIKDMKRDGIFALHTEEFLTKEAIEKYNIQVVPKHTVMLSFKLTIGRVKISEENMVTNEAIAQFRNSKLPYEYLYTYLDNFSFETLGSTSSIAQAINSRIIKSMPILIPERDLLNKYLNFARPIFSKMLILQKENIKLNRLKQVLLDKYF